jgi:hypothetical protein
MDISYGYFFGVGSDTERGGIDFRAVHSVPAQFSFHSRLAARVLAPPQRHVWRHAYGSSNATEAYFES